MLYYYNSPIGVLKLISDGEAIIGLYFMDDDISYINKELNDELNEELVLPVLKQCKNELDEYFNGTRKDFSVKVKTQGTAFMELCWNYLITIPYGTTATYGDVARGIENPKAVRAVGGANNKNKISIIYPCHRVIGSDGKLTGYGGGLWRKEWLLQHEKKFI